MERIALPGAWEGDALPGGRFCAAYPDRRILTNTGLFHAPDWLRYPRLSPLANTVVGTAQANPGRVYAVTAQASVEIGPQSCGLSAVIFWPDGTVAINYDCGAPYYSLGFRFITDRIYSGAETYADPVRNIFEWTELGDIVVGQGPEDGCHLLYQGRRYLVEPGAARVVRFARDGERLAVAMFMQGFGFVAHWLTVNEIDGLPDITVPPPPEVSMKPPVVTVINWTLDELLNGREFVFEDSANPELGYRIRVHVRDGSMYAEVENALGEASTGLARPVKPCDGDDNGNGHEPPDPPQPLQTRFSTEHGSFWKVGSDNRLEQSDMPQIFEVERRGGASVAIKTLGGQYLSAEGGGTLDYLVANRDSVGAWETFTTGSVQGDPLRVFFKTSDAGYFCAEPDGRITCNRPAPGPWETFESDVPLALSTPRLVVDGQYFRTADGARFHALECSEFSLYKRFLDGEDIDPILTQRSTLGFNLLRVWLLNTSVVPGGILPLQYADFYEALPEFLSRCSGFGLYVELTAFTQTQTLMPSEADQVSHWNRVVDAVKGSPNVLLELVNEADQHDNATSANFPRPSGVLASTGSNGSDMPPPSPDWDYCLFHTNDLPEWHRKTGHHGMETADIRGVPCITNENTRFDDRDSSTTHAYDAAAGAALLCAGACFHSVHGKLSELFTGRELECAEAWVQGAKSVPLEFQPGVYQRHDDLVGPDCIRAYSRTLPDGRSHLVKIRP